MEQQTPVWRLETAADHVLSARAADGDVDAFAVIVRRYAPRLRAYVQRMLNSTAELDDVVQETFVTAWKRLPELRDGANVKAWLYRIASSKAIDRIRARKPQVELDEVAELVPSGQSTADVVEARAGIEQLRTALAALPEQQRECWVLRELAGYSYDEIATELEIPATTVRGLLSRARKGILARMEDWR